MNAKVFLPAVTFLHENAIAIIRNGFPGSSLQSSSTMLSLFDEPT